MTDPEPQTPDDSAEPDVESGAGYGNHAEGYEDEAADDRKE